jgi:polyvinyl alcohol dehydrogenase (cytochrome)
MCWLAAVVWAQAPDGEAVFQRSCAMCHNGAADSRAPRVETLRESSPEAIIDVLVSGAMRLQGSRLGGAERRAVAEYLSGKKIGIDVAGASAGRCPAQTKFDLRAGSAWNGWGKDAANTRFQPTSQAGITAEQVPRLKLKWAFGYPDATSAWAQPSVAGGRVFVGSHNGTVYSLDAKTGCIYWTFGAGGGVRNAMAIGPRAGGRGYAVYFGDSSATAYALDATTGQLIWSRKVDDHPLARITGSPNLHQGRLYVPVSSYEEAAGGDPHYACCTFRGNLSALNAETGAVVWKAYTIPEPAQPRGKGADGVTLYGPAGVGIWSTPAIDTKRKVIYASTGNGYSEPQPATSDAVVAFDLATGKIKWARQVTPKDVWVTGCRAGSSNPNCSEDPGPDFDFGNPPILTTMANGKNVIVIGQKSGVGYALDPDAEGEVLWQYRAGEGSTLGGMEWGSAVDANNAYFPVSDMYASHPGGLHAVNLMTGQRTWFAPPVTPKCDGGTGGCSAAQSAAITVIPGLIFSGANDGVLRAYSVKNGGVVWEFNTNGEFKTVNGVPGKGASMIGPGPVIAGGMLFVNSGYAGYGGRAGNVLLALGLE